MALLDFYSQPLSRANGLSFRIVSVVPGVPCIVWYRIVRAVRAGYRLISFVSCGACAQNIVYRGLPRFLGFLIRTRLFPLYLHEPRRVMSAMNAHAK